MSKLKITNQFAEVVKGHAMKVRIDMTVGNPPFYRILDIFHWFAKVLSEFT